MIMGNVTGEIRAGKCSTFLEGQHLVLVEVNGQPVAAVDPIGSSLGDRVLLMTGNAALHCHMAAPADAVVVARLDREP